MGFDIDFLPAGNGEKSGDAIAFRFGDLMSGEREQQKVIVIDGGFQETGKKLVNHIRKFYQTNHVDLVISTHPDADHVAGLKVVLEEMSAETLWMHQPWNHSSEIRKSFTDGRVTDQSIHERLQKSLEQACDLEGLAKKKGVEIIEPFSGVTAFGRLSVIGPSKDYYENLLCSFREMPQEKQPSLMEKAGTFASEMVKKIAERFDYETLDDEGETSPQNNSSVILLAAMEEHNLLFTADAGIPALTFAADYAESIYGNFPSLGFIQVPHHGSRRNVGPTILDRIIGPKQTEEAKKMTAFVSAAEDGAPKHPAKKVTNAFRRRGAPVCVTRGQTIHHYRNAPDREGWVTIEPLPLFSEVDE